MLIPFLPKLPSELRNEVIIVVLTYIPYALSGISRSFSAFLLPQLRSSDSSFHITSEEETWIGSLTILTMPFGCLTAGVMMHYLGRKLCLLGILLPYIAAWAITVFAEDVNMLYLQTVLNGMGSGMTFCTATYLAEICCVKHRGPLLSLVEPMFYLGVVFCNIVLYFFGWQNSAKIFCALSAISFFSLFLLPESPNWLVMKGNTEKASQILTKVGRSEMQVTVEITEMEMQYKLHEEQHGVVVEVGVCRVIRNLVNKLSSCWKALLIMCGMFVFQQMTGYNALVSYTVMFFDELRLPVDSSICAIAYSACSFFLSFVSPAIAAYVGRKWSMAISGLGMALFMSVIFVYELIYYHVPAEDKPFYIIPLLSMYGCNISACLGLVMLPFIMVPEVVPAHMASIGCGFCGCLGYIVAGLVLKVFPHYLSYFGIQVTLASLALSAFCAVPFAYFVLPETRGKTNSEIQHEYFSGMTFCTATYVAEICSAKHRGPLLSLEEPVFNLGIALCNIVVHFNGWRHSAKGFLGISVLAFFLLFCLPESPNWLVMKGYSEKASRVLTKVRRSETEVKEEITEMEIHYELNRQEASINSGPGVVGALSNVLNRLSESRKAFLIMIGLFTFQQMTGYNVLVSYTVIFFDEMKLPADSSICAIVYSSAMFLISFIPPITTIYLGRKWSLAVSGLGMGLSLTVAAVYEFLYYQLPLEEKPFYLVPLGSIYVYNIFCSFGLMMLPFIMAGEVFPVHASGIACGVFGCVGYIIAGLVLKIFPYYLSWFGIEITLCTLALFAYASVPYAYYILPETHGKSINQIQLEYFSGDKSKRRATETTFA